MLCQNFNIIEFVVTELHLLEIEGVEFFVFFSNLVKIVFCFEVELLISKKKS
jgi:hypothetical protein